MYKYLKVWVHSYSKDSPTKKNRLTQYSGIIATFRNNQVKQTNTT